MSYVLASELSNQTSKTESLVVQTDMLAPITVTTAVIGSQGIGGVSVSSNTDGSFDVFWSLYSVTTGSLIPGPATEYEQAYSSSGAPLGSAVAISAGASGQSFSAATATASGGYILASDLYDASSKTESVVIQTDKLAPITVTTLADSNYVLGASVTSNADGSFDVFWNTYSFGAGNSFVPGPEYERAYSASGDPLDSAVAIATPPSSTQGFLAATATAGGGYVLASELSDATSKTESLIIQTDKLAPINVVTVTEGSLAIGGVSVASNTDGSFDVFYSLFSSAIVAGGLELGPATEFEQAYSASGDPLGSAIAISTASSNQSYVAAAGGTTPPPTVTGDLLFQNSGTGQASLWEMDGNTRVGGGAVSTNPGPSWKAVGTGDFFSSDTSDILWQNTGTGQVSVWEMDENTRTGGGVLSLNPGPAWKAVGTGDFNGEGAYEILWQNASTGQAAVWEMDGNTRTGGGAVSVNPGPAWTAIGTGDFYGQGDDDILWQDASTGQVSIWEMSGNTRTGGGVVSLDPGPSWKAIGTGDFTGDGLNDILFQNASTGQVAIWEMSETTRTGGGVLSLDPGPSWQAIGTGAGGADILFQNTSGQTAIWEMNGTARTGGGTVSVNAGSSWRAVGLN